MKAPRRHSSHRRIMMRTANIYRHQRERAKLPLPYDLCQLRSLVNSALVNGRCDCCAGALTHANFSIDHMTPIARGGSWEFSNLVCICQRCNEIKGSLLIDEYRELLDTMANWQDRVRQSVLARLRVGGRYTRR